MAKEEKRKTIRLLLLQAWRERWTDIEWGIHLKKIIPQGVSGDTYNLSELILNQALVGLSPNMLLLSYLKNAVSAQVVSFAATLQCIKTFDDLNKPHCTKALLDIVKSFLPMTGHYGASEDPVSLVKCLLGIMKWSLTCSHKALLEINSNKQNPEYVSIVESMCDILQQLLNNNSSQALIAIGAADDAETFHQIDQTGSNIRGLIGQLPNNALSQSQSTNVDNTLKLLYKIKEFGLDSYGILNYQWLHNPSVNVIIHQEATLNPTGAIDPIVDLLLLVEKLQCLSRSVLICDIIRACFLGIIDVVHGQHEMKWVAFTFLKVPQILQKIQDQTAHGNDKENMESALMMLFQYTSLIEAVDMNFTNYNCLQLLIDLLFKNNLITEAQSEKLLASRPALETLKINKPVETTVQPTPLLIVRAESTMASILKTLDADYTKNQDALLGVLCHMMSGKSFELVLAAAAATGKLRSLTLKLIKFNELAKSSPGEGSKGSVTRSLLFDISFLMLCHIVQLYGLEIISEDKDSDAASQESFFSQWAWRCLPLDGKYKSIDSYKQPEQTKVDVLLSQFNVGGELKTSLVKWFDVCNTAPFVIREVLHAWEAGVINQDAVKNFMDNMKSRLCCLSVVVCAWLCSYINMSADDRRQKPRQILQMIAVPYTGDATSQNYTERANLMLTICKIMSRDFSEDELAIPQHLTDNTMSHQLLVTTLKKIFKEGCVHLASVHTLDQLLSIGGVRWFCDNVITEMLGHQHPEDLTQAVSLCWGIFNLNIEQLSLCFLTHTLPKLLQGDDFRSLLLVDPKGKALSQFTVMLVMAAVQMRPYTGNKFPSIMKRGSSVFSPDFTFEEAKEPEDAKPAKQRKIQEEVLTLQSEFNFDLIESKDDDPTPTYDTKDKLNRAMVNLFTLLAGIINEPIMSPRNGFILHLVRETVKCGPQNARFVFQFLPSTMTSQLLKSFPEAFSNELLLAMSDLGTKRGRCIAANAVCQASRQASWQSQ